jgi:hypothetical protein
MLTLVFRSPVVIRATTCVPVPGIRPTSITAFGWNPRHRILVPPGMIRNTGGCMRTRGGHCFTLNDKCYIFFNLFSTFRQFIIYDPRRHVDHSFSPLIHDVLEF